MKRNEWLFLAAVLACALVFSATSILDAHRLLAPEPTGAAASGRAGRPRDVNIEQVRRLIEQRVLSNHEAAYYTPVPEPSGQESLSPDAP